MAPPLVHAILAIFAVVFVYFGAIQAGSCAQGYSLLYFGIAGLATASNVGLMPNLWGAAAIGVASSVLAIVGFVLLGAAGCSI